MDRYKGRFKVCSSACALRQYMFPRWEADIHHHRHDIHVAHHEAYDKVPQVEHQKHQPYASKKVIATPKTVSKCLRGRIADSKSIRRTFLLTFNAWIHSPFYPDLLGEPPRHPRIDRDPHTTVNLAAIHRFGFLC